MQRDRHVANLAVAPDRHPHRVARLIAVERHLQLAEGVNLAAINRLDDVARDDGVAPNLRRPKTGGRGAAARFHP